MVEEIEFDCWVGYIEEYNINDAEIKEKLISMTNALNDDDKLEKTANDFVDACRSKFPEYIENIEFQQKSANRGMAPSNKKMELKELKNSIKSDVNELLNNWDK